MTGARTTMLVLSVAVAVAGGASHADAAARQVPAAAYVHKVCVAVSTFEQRVTDRSLRLAERPAPRRLLDRKRALRAFFRDLVGYLRTTVKSIARASVPAVPDGAHIAAAVRGALHDTLMGLQKALTAVKRMPTSSERAFRKAADTIDRRLQTALDTAVSTLATLSDSPALDAIASRDPACV